MFSSGIITKIFKNVDRNIEFTGESFEKSYKGVNYLVFKAILTYSPSHCPHCNSANHKHSIVKNGSQKVNILMNKIGDTPCKIELKKQRFYCKHCNKTFIASSSLAEKSCSIGNSVKLSIIENLTELISCKYIAKMHYVSSSSVLRILRNRALKANKFNFPTSLAIDEFKSLKNVKASMSVNLTNNDTGQIYDIFYDRRKFKLEQYLSDIPESVRNNVKTVTTDMYPTYIELSKKLFKNARIVIDKFHIVQLFTRELNKLRINVMKSFNTKSNEYKVLKRYWKVFNAKEWELNGIHFYKRTHFKNLVSSRYIKTEMLGYSDKLKEANDFYQHLLLAINTKNIETFKMLINKDLKEVPICFHSCIRTLKKYEDYVINAITCNYTNARVEGNNNLIKSLKRVCYGFRSYRNMKLRIMLLNERKTIKKNI